MATHRTVIAGHKVSCITPVVSAAQLPGKDAGELAQGTADHFAVACHQKSRCAGEDGARGSEVGILRIRSDQPDSSFHAVVGAADQARITRVDSAGQVSEAYLPSNASVTVLKQARAFAGNATLVVHNAALFRRWWSSEPGPGVEIESGAELICTLLLARRSCQSLDSHKLCDLEKALNLREASGNHALHRAEQVAQLFAAIRSGLITATPDGVVDASYLLAYQRKSKSALPDLTQMVKKCASSTSRGCRKNLATDTVSANIDKTAEPSAKVGSEHSNQQQAEKSETRPVMDPELEAAYSRHEALLEFFEQSNQSSAELLLSPSRFMQRGGSSIQRRDYIIYDKSGMPADIEYLSVTKPRPEEPPLSARPDPNDFVEEVSLWDRLTLRKSERYETWKTSYLAALKRWERNREKEMSHYKEQARHWQAMARSIDQINDRRYRQCVKDQLTWWAEKLALTDKEHDSGATQGLRYPVCDSRDTHVVQTFFTTVLHRLSRPDFIPLNARVVYRPGRRILELSVQLLHPDTLPDLAAMCRGRAGEAEKVRLLSKGRRTALYARIVWEICLQALRLLACVDKHHLVEHILLNGVVTDSGKAFGAGSDRCIASVCVSKARILGSTAGAAGPAECFAGLGGRGSAKDLARLRTIIPFTLKDAEAIKGSGAESHSCTEASSDKVQ